MENVEILVPDHAMARLKEALGPLPSARFAIQPSRHVRPRLLVTWLEDLETPEGRHGLEQLYVVSWQRLRNVQIIYIGTTVGGLHSRLALQTLARWSHIAAHEPFIASDPSSVRRMVLARRNGAEKELIASASIDDGKLVVWSCEPRRFEVAVAEIPVLAKMPAHMVANFELSASGSRIRWPGADVDINLDTIREHADPDVRRKHEARAREEAKQYAGAIRRFRVERGLKQTDIEGLTDRQVRRLEEGDTVPHIDTLKKLAVAHDLSIDDYLKELAKRSRGQGTARSSAGRGQRART